MIVVCKAREIRVMDRGRGSACDWKVSGGDMALESTIYVGVFVLWALAALQGMGAFLGGGAILSILSNARSTRPPTGEMRRGGSDSSRRSW